MWKVGIQLFFTGQIDLVLSAYTNLYGDTQKDTLHDWLAYGSAILIVVLYAVLIIMMAHIMRECLRVIYEA